MGLIGTALVSSVLVSGVMTSTLAAIAWKRRPQPGSDAFTALMIVISIWSFSSGIGLVTANPTLRTVLARVQMFSVFVSVTWVAFALAYTGYDHLITWKTIGLLSVIPTLTVLLVWTNPIHHLMWQTSRLVTVEGLVFLEHQVGPWWYLNASYVYVTAVLGSLLLVRLLFFKGHLYADQAVALIFGTLTPFAVSLLSILGIVPFRAIDITPVGYAVTGLAFGIALYRYDLLDWLPATSKIGRATAMDELREGILIVDTEGRIVDSNRTAGQVFDQLSASAVGRPLGDLVPEFTEELDKTGNRISTHTVDYRTFEVSKSDIHDDQGHVIGHTLMFWDITDVRLRQQRLEVLNRVLRHNLRNDMDAVRGYAELISEDEYDSAELADRIVRTSTKLVELGSKAREVERIMATRADDRRPLDVTSIIGTVVDRMGDEYSPCNITTKGPDELWMVADKSVLEPVFENLLENTIQHNDRAVPQVTVTASVDKRDGREWVQVAVEDNGPGIPEHEREAIVQGEETPLEHASGLGLWLVRWGTSQLGGDLSFEDNDPRGSVVTIRLPRRAESPTVDADNPDV